jgi:flagella basal body P-ring formation protein FlgA
MLGWLVLVATALGAASGVRAESPTVERVRADLERFIGERVEDESASIEIPPLRSFDFDVSRATGEVRTEISTRSATPFRGRIALTVALYVGDQLVKRAVVSPYVEIADRVVVTRRALARGHVLTEEDLTYSARDRAASPADAARDLASLVGLRTKRGISGDQVVRHGDFEAIPVVERGDRVTLVLIQGPLLIQAAGLARETGASGEWIRVVNLDSKRELTGRVDREGRVHVAF